MFLIIILLPDISTASFPELINLQLLKLWRINDKGIENSNAITATADNPINENIKEIDSYKDESLINTAINNPTNPKVVNSAHTSRTWSRKSKYPVSIIISFFNSTSI